MPVHEGPALIVVWADPGVTTGWSVHRVNIAELCSVGQVASVGRMWWRVGQFRTAGTSEAVDAYLALCRAVYEKAGPEDLVVIGCEGFILRMQSTDHALLEPVRFLAVLQDRLRGTEYGREVGVQVQMSGEAFKTVTDARLKLWGLWQSGLEHGRDAQRHGLLFLRRFATQPMLRKRVGWEE